MRGKTKRNDGKSLKKIKGKKFEGGKTKITKNQAKIFEKPRKECRKIEQKFRKSRNKNFFSR